YNNCVGWLTFLSAAFPLVVGVIISDYLMNRRRYEHIATTRMMSVTWVAILTVVLGLAAGNWLTAVSPTHLTFPTSVHVKYNIHCSVSITTYTDTSLGTT
ncbi:cytosine permease, partial [Escherichia coli]|uniref:cytosine permease n=1 Tax=Escherichia coli TaxID=562 RepID=UPI00158FD959